MNFVKIDQRAQAARAALLAHPGIYSRVQQGDEEHTLAVVQVCQEKDAVARFPVVRVKHLFNVQRLPFNPGLEGRRGQEAVQQHSQLAALFLGEEIIDRKSAQFFQRRILRLQNQVL